MEPNKLDQYIKEQLDPREIKPSEMVWNKLDRLLSAAEKPKRKFLWMYIAASFVGFLVIGTVFFTVFNIEIVEKNVPTVVLEQNADGRIDKKDELTNGEVIFNTVQNNTVIPSKVVVNNIMKAKSQKLANKEDTVTISNQSTVDHGVLNYNENMNSREDSKSKYISAEKLLAEVSNTKSESNVSFKKINRTVNGIAVNANSLLSNVETVLVNRNYEE
jgi:preprotein translocase subunit Sss1